MRPRRSVVGVASALAGVAIGAALTLSFTPQLTALLDDVGLGWALGSGSRSDTAVADPKGAARSLQAARPRRSPAQ